MIFKKSLLLILGGLTASGAAAQTELPEHVSFHPAMFALRISPSGKWMGNFTGYAKVYDLDNDIMTEYKQATLSQGNSIADNGLAAAGGVFLKDGESINVRTPEGKGGFDIEAVTPDCKYVTGTWSGGPFVGELDENYNVVNAVRLPRPSEDLFGSRPQWVNTTWISRDGNTVAGQVQDSYGMYNYPIIFYNTPQGWEYSLPTASLFNPNGIETKLNPYDHEPPYPYPEDYMSQMQAALYQEAYKAYVAGNGVKPDPSKFMTEEEYEQYLAAVDEYNEWYDNSRENFNNFLNNYYAILESSPSFDTIALHPSGEYLYVNGGVYDQYGNRTNYMYELTRDGVSRMIPLVENGQAPLMVLADGTLLSSPPLMAGFNGYVLEPGAEEFVNIIEWLQPEHPEIANWIEENFPGGAGLITMSDDRSIIAGTVYAGQLSDEMFEVANYRYATYIINFNGAGIESVVEEPSDGVYKVFNLQGVKIMETKDVSDLNTLGKGIHVINGKKVIVK